MWRGQGRRAVCLRVLMARTIWKGAISFGLVHVPVALLPATREGGVDFDWLDRRSLDPVGYQRINKRTGRKIEKDDIVKGVKHSSGRYVLVGDDEIRAAYPKTTQTIAIEAFVKAEGVPFTHLETPYYLEPLSRGEKVYALLREAMREAGVIGIARVVLHSREHLAALVAAGPALMLDMLRWPGEIRPAEGLNLPAEGKAAGLKEAELQMAGQLIADMTREFRAEDYQDRFTDAIHALVEQRAAAGHAHEVQPLEEAPAAAGGQVIDLTELLRRSLGRREAAAAAPKKAAAVRAPRSRSKRAA